jgi:hypothetical protein
VGELPPHTILILFLKKKRRMDVRQETNIVYHPNYYDFPENGPDIRVHLYPLNYFSSHR